jgi:hypothetical protein
VRDERAGTRDERDVMPFSRDVNCCKQTRGPAAAHRVLEYMLESILTRRFLPVQG